MPLGLLLLFWIISLHLQQPCMAAAAAAHAVPAGAQQPPQQQQRQIGAPSPSTAFSSTAPASSDRGDPVAASKKHSVLATTAADAAGSRSSSGRRLLSTSHFGLGLPDLEALLSEDPTDLESFAAAMQPASMAAAASERSSQTSTGPSPLAANCFSLPVEVCIAIRRANLNSIAFAYPYVLGYLVVALSSLMQTLLAATRAGAVVIDVNLVLTLAQQASLIVALLGGLGIVVEVDHLYHILPM